MSFDREFWEKRWAQALHEHGDKIAGRPPNMNLVEAAAPLTPGLALDAGCGNGAETLWLAANGWRVTAVDFSAMALESGRAAAQKIGADVAERIEWVEGDLGAWTPPSRRYDLVASLYVHVAGSVQEMVAGLGAAVAPGGTLLLIGHRPVDPATGLATPAAGQSQVSVADAAAALDSRDWDVLAAERPRAAAGEGVDAVVRATLRPAPVTVGTTPANLRAASPQKLTKPIWVEPQS